MRLLAEIHGYPPHHNSGAEWMAHHVFRYMAQQGHEVVILLNFESYLGKVDKPYEFEGVKVVNDKEWRIYYAWCDIVFTHLDKTGKAYNRAKLFKRPLVHFIHNDYKNVVVENMNGISQHAIYNANWVRDAVKDRQKYISRSIVVHPPVYVDDYKVKRINDYITLINLNPNKGGDFLQKLAKRMPDRKFMGVMGSYGHQLMDVKIKNIHYLENTGDIKKVYKRTRILLMPSIYESYGRTAIEACSSGIPVICNSTPGLRESLGKSGIYCNRENIEEWVKAIENLDDINNYNLFSKLSLERAKEVNPEKELINLEKWLYDTN